MLASGRNDADARQGMRTLLRMACDSTQSNRHGMSDLSEDCDLAFGNQSAQF